MKIGTTQDSLPRFTFPTLVGKPTIRGQPVEGNFYIPDTVVGKDTETYRQYLELTYPIEHGQIAQWQLMNEIWRHSFSLLQADPSN